MQGKGCLSLAEVVWSKAPPRGRWLPAVLRRRGSGAAARGELGGRSAPAELPPAAVVHGAPGSTRILSAEFRAWVVL